MTKNKFVYSILAVLFVILVATVTITYLIVNKSERGNSEVNKKYYDIIFNNVTVDYETSMSIKINDDKDSIHIDIPNINEFNNKNSFTIDVKNIGNIDAYVDKMFLSNIVSNVDTSKVNIDISLVKDDIIKGGESKKLIITISYLGKPEKEDMYYNFNINYSFVEVVL